MPVFATQIAIKINGKTYEDYLFSNISLIQKVQHPNELSFLMSRKTPEESEGDLRFSISGELLGKPVSLYVEIIRGDEKGEIHTDSLSFSGIIFNAGLQRKNSKSGLDIEVIAYSPDYLLLDHPHCFSYEKKTLKDIVTQTIKPYDIPVKISPAMSEEIPYTVQYNESNYSFLSRLASRFGEWFYYNGEELVFGRSDRGKSQKLHFLFDVRNYQYRLDIEHQDYVHSHHNYLNYSNTGSDSLSVSGDPLHYMTDIAYKESVSLYKKKTFEHQRDSAPEESSFDETKKSVRYQSLGKKGQMLVCHGSSNRADLRLGSLIQIQEEYENGRCNKGTITHEELLICRLTHTIGSNGFYENEFTGIPADSEYPPYTGSVTSPQSGAQRAVVRDNRDPEKLGRVRVQFLWQQEQDSNLMTPWIRIAQPHGGNEKGFYFIPEIDEEVMVGFENGNAEKPYVTGTLYHGQQLPGSHWANDSNDIKAIRTRNGHTVEINDAGAGGFIRIYDNEKENYVLTLSTDEKLIKLESTGNIAFRAAKSILLEAGEDVRINAEKNIIHDAGENIEETAGNNITIDADNNITETAGKDISQTAKENMNTNVQAGGSHPDLLSSIMGVTIRNEEKIAAEDREFCEERQAKLYATLHQLKWWYDLFAANAERYKESRNLVYEENGSIKKYNLSQRLSQRRTGRLCRIRVYPRRVHQRGG